MSSDVVADIVAPAGVGAVFVIGVACIFAGLSGQEVGAGQIRLPAIPNMFGRFFASLLGIVLLFPGIFGSYKVLFQQPAPIPATTFAPAPVSTPATSALAATALHVRKHAHSTSAPPGPPTAAMADVTAIAPIAPPPSSTLVSPPAAEPKLPPKPTMQVVPFTGTGSKLPQNYEKTLQDLARDALANHVRSVTIDAYDQTVQLVAMNQSRKRGAAIADLLRTVLKNGEVQEPTAHSRDESKATTPPPGAISTDLIDIGKEWVVVRFNY